MKKLLKKIEAMEVQMDKAQQWAEYWLQDEHFDEERSNEFEQESDAIYENLYQLFGQAADQIVDATSGQIDKVMAMTMIRCRRKEVKRIFA